MILRVFISYSSEDPESRSLRDALATALGAEPERFGLLIDNRTLEPGDAWRARINLWVDGCDAALVLLSQEALKSPYVIYENSVLAHRSDADRSLLIIPVLLDDVNIADLKRGLLWPAQLDERQGISGRSEPEIVQAVLGRLGKAQRCKTPTPVERRALRLAELFKGLEEPELLEAAGEIDLDLEPWSLHKDLRLRLALQLQSVGMAAAAPALKVLRRHFPEETRANRMRTIVELVGSSWVDSRSAARLAKLIDEARDARSVGVNGRRTWTAKMYVLGARGESTADWYFAPCNGIFGEDAVETLKAKLWSALSCALTGDDENVDKEDLRKDLAVFEKARDPVVVAFHHAGITRPLLAELRQEFPSIIFFVLTGEASPLAAEAALEVLIPRLGPGDEDASFDRYDDLERLVRARKGMLP